MKRSIYALGILIFDMFMSTCAFIVIGSAAALLHYANTQFGADGLPYMMSEVFLIVEWIIVLFDIYLLLRLIWTNGKKFLELLKE